MRRLLILTVCLLLSQVAVMFAQGGTIKGKALDKDTKKPLIGASVYVINSEKEIRNGNKTNNKGEFEIDGVRRGKYTLKVTYIGYDSLEKEFTMEGRKTIDLGDIFVQPSAVTTAEVEVTAQAPIGEIKEDTVILNANRFKTEPDASAEDLVKKMPGVQIDQGTVKSQGEEVKKVLVDGKPFFGDDPSMTLKNIPAEIIDKVQVYDKMSDQAEFTGFDDGESTKTMNLITKNNKREGKFGKFSGGLGNTEKYIGSANMNFFKGSQRISILGLTNNINQQNFAFMDIMDMMGGSGGPGGGFGRAMFSRIGSAMQSLNMQPPRQSPGMSGGGPGGGGFGNFFIGQLDGLSTTHAFGLNYSDDLSAKVDVSGSYFFNYTENKNDQDVDRDFLALETDSLQKFLQSTNTFNKNVNHRFNMKLRWQIDSVNSLQIQPSFVFQSTNANTATDNNTEINYLQNIIPLSSTNTDYNSKYDGFNFNNDLLLKHRFELPGRTISLNINNSYNDKAGSSNLYTLNKFAIMNRADTINQQSEAPNGGYGVSGTATYTEPFGKTQQLQLNYRLSYNSSYSDKRTFNYNYLTSDFDLFDTDLSNVFDNDYLTHRAGAGYRYKEADWNAMAMVYYQQAFMQSSETSPDTLTAKYNFSDVLPSIRINYRPTKTMNVMFNYRTNTNNPSVTQLQNVLDNSNQQSMSIGNPNLKQSYSHTIMLRLHNFSQDFSKIYGVFAMVNLMSDYIGSSTVYNTGMGPLKIKDVYPDFYMDSVRLTPGSQFTMNKNLDGFLNATTFLNYGIPVNFIKSNLNLNAGGLYTRVPSEIYNLNTRKFEQNYLNSYNINLIASISSNISEKVDFTISHRANFNVTRNTFMSTLNSKYNSYTTAVNFKWNFWKGFFLQGDYRNQYYTGLIDEANNNINLLNFSLGTKFLSNSFEAKLSVYDALNQNKSISTNVTDFYVEYQRNTTLNQYFMFTLTYNIRQFKMGMGMFGF